MAAAVTSSTARSKTSSLVRDGRVAPLSLRTNWIAAARISSSVADGSKFARVLILRHIAGSARVYRSAQASDLIPQPFLGRRIRQQQDVLFGDVQGRRRRRAGQ